MTFADKAIAFHKQLHYTGAPLPAGIHLLNPFKESEEAMRLVEAFFHRYFNDKKQRHLILGINPGRFGAGVTGIPFTDPKRVLSELKIPFEGKVSHEPSSVFIYDMIHAYGGVKAFYKDFIINSPCPLGFTSVDANGREKNYNYYDSKALADAVKEFMIKSIYQLIDLGINTDVCFCLGTGKNEKFLSRLNAEHGFFKKLVALEHPRYVMQYKYNSRQAYIEKYLEAFKAVKKQGG